MKRFYLYRWWKGGCWIRIDSQEWHCVADTLGEFLESLACRAVVKLPPDIRVQIQCWNKR
jgi:hypothetical protein